MNNQPVLRPDLKSAMLPRIVTTLVIGLLIGVLTGFFVSVLVGIVAFTLVMSFNLLSYFNLKSREYRFKQGQVEVYEGFLNITQDNVPYNRVTDISLHKPLIQRLMETGSIKINTAGGNMKEVNISYVKNPDQEYKRVKQITG